MSTAELYRASDVSAAAAELLAQALPAHVEVHHETIPPDARAPYVLVTSGPGAPAGPPMAGDQTNAVRTDSISVGRNHTEAGALGDLVRWHLIGRDGDARFVEPMPLDGRVVLDRRSQLDGHLDLVGNVPQWFEGYEFDVGIGQPA